MAQKAPGKAHRAGLTIIEITRMFPDNETAERWFIQARWPDGPRCPYCQSEKVQHPTAHKTMTHRCQSKGCRKPFSAKTGTVMESSKVSYQEWAIAVYLFVTNLKGVSSMHLRRDLGRTQKTAWHLAHRLREVWAAKGGKCSPGQWKWTSPTSVARRRTSMPPRSSTRGAGRLARRPSSA